MLNPDSLSLEAANAVSLESPSAPVPAGGAVERSNFPAMDDVKVGMAVNRIDKHERHKGMVAEHLRSMGLEVTEAPATSSYDLLVNQEVRVTLRVAYPGMRRHRVTVGGRSYRYRYETWHFNFHHHGRLDERYTDFFVCIAKDPKQGDEDRIYVIPWASVSGKTFSLHSGRGSYRGRYAPFRDAWEAIGKAGERSAGLRRVA